MISVDSFRKITNPVFNDEHGLSINIICDIDGIGNDIPFTAMKMIARNTVGFYMKER